MDIGAQPLVSVIVPCYNHAACLPRTINCLKDQTVSDWECIIVDDGSPDNSWEVAQSLAASDSRIRCIQQENKGPAGARNRGLDEVRGKYVQFLDADDTIAPNKLELQLAQLSSTDDLAMAYCDFRWCDREGNDIEWPSQCRVALNEINPLHDVIVFWQNEITIPVHATLLDARFFSEHGIRQDESLRANEDYDLWVNVFALHPKVFYLDQKLVSYHVNPGSVSSDMGRLRNTYFQIIERQERRFANDDVVLGLLRKKKNLVRFHHMKYASPVEVEWWIYHAKNLLGKLMPSKWKRRLRARVEEAVGGK